MILGVHASVRRGLAAALDEPRELGCRALQILPYQRHAPPSDAELAAFREKRAALGVERLLVHSRFVPSLCSSDAERRRRSVEHLARELSLCLGLGGDAYVLHAGAWSQGSSAVEGERLFAESVRRAAGQSGFDGLLLLENVPGGGRRLGGSLEELARLLDSLKSSLPKLGACLDTAHAFAAGYDLSRAEGVMRFLSRAHRLLGDAVRAFHLNDTRALLGSRLENHAHWGEGRLGRECLRAFLQREEYADAPAILETPKEPGADRRNLELARSLQ